tara:strand:- start:239 stop:433 length:195 start_codon:yes stop_codon:yes gene_type:complete
MIKISSESIHSLFLFEGSVRYKENILKEGTFLKIQNLDQINFKVMENSKIFEIISPEIPSYKTL